MIEIVISTAAALLRQTQKTWYGKMSYTLEKFQLTGYQDGEEKKPKFHVVLSNLN